VATIAVGSKSKKGLTAITVTFDEAVASASATNPGTYTLLGGVKKKRKLLFSKGLAMRRVDFDGDARVTISLAKPFKGPVQVTVHGGVVARSGATSQGDVAKVVP
jgi:hypothetical protein